MSDYLQVDPVLTQAALHYSNDKYIAEQVFPTIQVNFQSGKHYVYNQSRFRLENTGRGAGANSNEVKHRLSSGLPYYCEDHALKEFVPDEDVKNAAPGMDPYMDATEMVTDLLMVDREKELADLITSTSNLTQNTTLSGTDKWSDYTNSDPFDDIETGIGTIHSAIGVDPTHMILGRQVWNKLKHHPDLLERVKYSQKAVLTVELFASIIGMNPANILIGSASYNSADEGQTDARSYIWGKDVVLFYRPDGVKPKMMTLGLNYNWIGEGGMKVEKLRGSDEEDRKGTYVRAGNWYYDQNIVAAAAGYLLKSVVA